MLTIPWSHSPGITHRFHFIEKEIDTQFHVGLEPLGRATQYNHFVRTHCFNYLPASACPPAESVFADKTIFDDRLKIENEKVTECKRMENIYGSLMGTGHIEP